MQVRKGRRLVSFLLVWVLTVAIFLRLAAWHADTAERTSFQARGPILGAGTKHCGDASAPLLGLTRDPWHAGGTRWMNHTSVPFSWRHTAVLVIDAWAGDAVDASGLADTLNCFTNLARSAGATIVHACFDCYLPLTAANTSDVALECAADMPCSIPSLRPAGERVRVANQDHQYFESWPFMRPFQAPCGCAGAGDAPYDPMQHTCEERWHGNASAGRDPGDNRMRRDLPSSVRRMSDKVERRPEDVFIFDEDWVWRVLAQRGIKTLLFAGTDANECVLYTRTVSMASMINRGWSPGDIFVLPDCAFSGYLMHGVSVPWRDVGSRVWARGVAQRFGVGSIFLRPGPDSTADAKAPL